MDIIRTPLESLVDRIQSRLNEALTSLTHKSTELKISKFGLMPIVDAQNNLSCIQGRATTIYIPIIDNIMGDIFVFLPNDLANDLADIMIGNEVGTTKIMGDFESSALKEFGNITFGVIVTEIANALGISMMLTVPNLATDMVNALVDQILAEYGETANDMLAIEMPFTLENFSQEGTFLILFDKASSNLIESKLSGDLEGLIVKEGADGEN